MRRDNRGFSLIELLIAISVLSVMSGVLLRSFVLSRRFNAKARVDEIVLDAGEKTMEAIKGTSLTELDAQMKNQLPESESSEITLNGITYTCVKTAQTAASPASEEADAAAIEADENDATDENEVSGTSGDSGNYKYVLTSEPQTLGGTRGNGSYVIEAEIRWSLYGDPDAAASDAVSPASDDDSTEASGSVPDRSSVNTSQAPRIADVSIPQNIVLDHETLLSKEAAWWMYFDMLNESLITRDEEGKENDSACYAPEETGRFLSLKFSESTASSGSTTKLTMNPELIYVLPSAAHDNIWKNENKTSLADNVRKKIYPLGTITRSFDASAGDLSQILPRIYLFLPHYTGGKVRLDGVYVEFNKELNHRYEFYLVPTDPADRNLIPVNGSTIATGQILNKTSAGSAADAGNGLIVYTFSDQTQSLDIAADAARKRMFEIQVSVYEKNHESEKPVLELHSTKRE